MPPVTTPLKTYCAMGGIQREPSGVDDRHERGLALSHLLDAEGSRQDVADLIEVARTRCALVVDLLSFDQKLRAVRQIERIAMPVEHHAVEMLRRSFHALIIHGNIVPADFVSRTLGFDYLSDHLLVAVDCTDMPTRAREDLITASRVRLRPPGERW